MPYTRCISLKCGSDLGSLKSEKKVIKMSFEGLLLDVVAKVKSNVLCYERLWNLSIE